MCTRNDVKVSIVIVCMNNLDNLYPCLDSIIKHTRESYEIFVVAFMFTVKNMEKLKFDYPMVKIIESNRLRGFSENNNLALKQAKGEYCLIINDDTYFDQPIVEQLIATFERLPENVAIVSPVTLNKNGSIQRNGKPKYDLFTCFLEFIKILPFYERFSKYNNKDGIYQSYNITGACFLIRTKKFKDVGWFDERYYFCPEDIALSTTLNRRGQKCYVNTDVVITHTGGGTWSKMQSATMPTSEKGCYIFFCENNILKKCVFLSMSYFFHFVYGILWRISDLLRHTDRKETMYKAHFNTLVSIGSSLTPKDVFVKYYTKLNDDK